MKIIYVHHGNRKVGNPPSKSDDLTELGEEDCKLVAKLLDNEKLKNNLRAIYTSKTFRCKKTAEIINQNLQLPIFEDERFDEYKTFENETWIDLQKRVGKCIDDIISKYNKNDVVICVTSGVNIVAFINKSYNLPPSENAPFLGIPSCSPVVFDYKGE